MTTNTEGKEREMLYHIQTDVNNHIIARATKLKIADDRSKATLELHGDLAGEIDGPIKAWWIDGEAGVF